nr:MAG TPA: hypothetical protein [Caudoviricetes sp.]
MLLSASYLNIARITRAFLPIFKVRKSHFGLMTYQIKIFSRHLSNYSGIIQFSHALLFKKLGYSYFLPIQPAMRGLYFCLDGLASK